MTSSRQPENDAQPNDECSGAFKGAFEELEDALRAGFEGMTHDISLPEIEQSRAKFSIHFGYREYSITPDPNIMAPDDNELWFTLFRHFIDRCDT